MGEFRIYRTELGTIMRVSLDGEGRISVELLKQRDWVAGPIGMAGLRLEPTTTLLTEREIRGLLA